MLYHYTKIKAVSIYTIDDFHTDLFHLPMGESVEARLKEILWGRDFHPNSFSKTPDAGKHLLPLQTL